LPNSARNGISACSRNGLKISDFYLNPLLVLLIPTTAAHVGLTHSTRRENLEMPPATPLDLHVGIPTTLVAQRLDYIYIHMYMYTCTLSSRNFLLARLE
jgi:hypothetical protein